MNKNKRALIGCLFLAIVFWIFQVSQRRFGMSEFNAVEQHSDDEVGLGIRNVAPVGDKAKSLSDMSQKKHFYDPETTLDRFSFLSSDGVKLAWVLAPFQPTAEEFQILARHEAEMAGLSEVVSEEAFFTVKGRALYMDGVSKLKRKLKQSLGSDRFADYEYKLSTDTGYPTSWRVLTVNGFGEDRITEMQELANKYTRTIHGTELNPQKAIEGWKPPEDSILVKEAFRQRILAEFGEQVLFDIMNLSGMGLFNGIESDPMHDLATYRAAGYREAWEDEDVKARMKSLYKSTFASDELNATEPLPSREKLEALANRERNFQLEFGQQVAETLAGDKGARPSSTMP